MKGQIITVWFSCGAASAVAAKKTIELYGKDNFIEVVNTPIKEEHSDNRRFLKDVEKWLGVKIKTSINKDFPNSSAREIWAKKRFMSSPQGAPCTGILKKQARYQWEAEHFTNYIVLGFTAEERDRHDALYNSERCDLLPVLIELGITKNKCFEIITKAGLRLPEIYAMGYPNGNCIGCPKATSPTYWNLVRRTYPDVFKDRARQSRILGARLVVVKGERIFLDELDPDAVGKPIKSWDCGTFCDSLEKLEET